MIEVTSGLIFSSIKAVLLLALGAVAFHRRRVANVFLPHSFLSFCVGYGALSLFYNVLLWLTPEVSLSHPLWHLFYFNRAVIFILMAGLLIEIVWRDKEISKKIILIWFSLVSIFSVTSFLVSFVPPNVIPNSFFVPFNYFYYLPRFILFGVLAAFSFRAVRTKNLMLAALSFASSLYFVQTVLKLYQPVWAVFAIQVTLDSIAGLVFAALLFLSLYQHKLELAFFAWARDKARTRRTVSLSLQTAGFLQFLFVGTAVVFSKDDDDGVERDSIIRKLDKLLQTSGNGKQKLFTYHDLIPIFGNDNLKLIKFMRQHHVLPRIIDGSVYYMREDLSATID